MHMDEFYFGCSNKDIILNEQEKKILEKALKDSFEATARYLPNTKTPEITYVN